MTSFRGVAGSSRRGEPDLGDGLAWVAVSEVIAYTVSVDHFVLFFLPFLRAVFFLPFLRAVLAAARRRVVESRQEVPAVTVAG